MPQENSVDPATGRSPGPPQPAVNILMATYNGQEHLREQIASIQRQTCREWVLYISDDRSTDSTPEILAEAAAGDSRIRILPSPEAGGCAASNFLSAIRLVPPGPLMLSDQDDVWFDDKIEVSLAAMDAEREPNGARTPLLVHTDAQVTDDDLRPLHASFKRFSEVLDLHPCLEHALVENSVTGNSCLLSPELVELVKRTDPRTRLIMHDWWIYLVAAGFGRVIYLDAATLAYRQHEANAVGARAGARTPVPSLMAEAMRRAGASVEQARSLLETYETLLAPAVRDEIALYANITEVPRLRRGARLSAVGIRKSRWQARAVHLLAMSMLTEARVEGAL